MPSETVVVDGVRLAYDQWGQADALVCLHGGMGVDSSYLKTPALLTLASGRRRLVIYDQRGHGASDRAPAATYTHARWVADLRGLAGAVAAGPFALLGHSYGGFLALEFAALHRAALSHLILVGTSAGPVRTDVPDLRSDAAVREFFRAWWPLFFPGPDKHWGVFDGM